MQDEMADEKLTQGLFSIRWNGSSPPDTEMAEATEWQPYQYGEECFDNGKWEPCDQYGKNREGWECEIKPGVWEPCVPLKHRHNPKTVKNKIEAKKNYLTSKPTFYKHCNYGGYAIGLRKSSSWIVKDGLKNDDLSSLKVPKGYTATVYQHWKYGGKKKTFGPGSYSCLTKYRMKGRTTWNDQISSIKIAKVGAKKQAPKKKAKAPKKKAKAPKKKAPKKKAPKKKAPKKKAKKFAGWNRFKKMKKTHRKGWGKLKNWGKKFAKKVKGGWRKFKKKVKKATKAKSKGWKTKRWGSIKRASAR